MGVIEELRKPNEAEIISILGKYAETLRQEHRYDTSIIAVKRALKLEPEHPGLWGSLGCSYWHYGKFEAALEPLLKAVEGAPEECCHVGNLGLLYHSLRDYEKAEACFIKAMALAKKSRKKAARVDYLGVVWDLALMRLEIGDWERGLQGYESRIELKAAGLYPKMPVPIWQGEPLDGKTLYLQAEQGLGDRILFSRYLQLIKDRWPTCTIKGCFNEALADLFWEYRVLTEMLPHGIPWPDDIDYGVYQASLPYLLGTRVDTIPLDPGYIYKRVKRQYDLGGLNLPYPRLPSLKVGIAWTGNPGQAKNHLRTIPFEKMLTLAENVNVTLYSFQVGSGSEAIKKANAEELVVDMGATLEREGFVAAGVAMLEMDLIVTVCTSTAHLAGSLGIPTWLLLSWDPYWIWLNQGDTTPWYPSIRIFRQDRPGDWDSVMNKVLAELPSLIVTPLTADKVDPGTFYPTLERLAS